MAGVGVSELRGMHSLRKDCFNAVVDSMAATRPGFDVGVAKYARLEG